MEKVHRLKAFVLVLAQELGRKLYKTYRGACCDRLHIQHRSVITTTVILFS